MNKITGKSYLSSKSVGAENFSGRIRFLKEIGRVASQLSHLSEITLM
jgi:pterin-4a-carbinolamine dehydratase